MHAQNGAGARTSAILLPEDESARVLVAGRTLIQLAHVVVRIEDMLMSREFGLSYRQMRILKHVNGGVTSGTELAKIFGVTAPAISETLESLVRKGLLKRRPHASDRRAVKLVLTAKGTRLNTRAEEGERELAREVLAPLGDEEVETLLALAEKLLVPNQQNLINRQMSNN